MDYWASSRRAHRVEIIEISTDAIYFVCWDVSGALCIHTNGVAAVAMSIINYLFSSSIFPIIFAIAVRGTAQHAKIAASLLAACLGGGTFGPFAQHAAALSYGQPRSLSDSIALWSTAAIFVLYLNLCLKQSGRLIR